MTQYDPPLEEYCEILRDYALYGLRFFSSLGEARQSKIRKCLGNQIEEKEQELRRKFNGTSRRIVEKFYFIPMPQPGGQDFQMGFFVPRFNLREDTNFLRGFDIVLWIDESGDKIGKTLAFRLEASDDECTAHSYPHLQLSRDVADPRLRTSVEHWLPDSYPAFPILQSTPIAFFVTTVTSVHGYSRAKKTRFVPETIRQAMTQGYAIGRRNRLLGEIERLLG